MQEAIRGERGSDVPCHGCTACCTSYQFVTVEPDERETLARIPAELLFPAPGRPRGHMVLGYDEQGRCPMLVDGACSVYDHRPRACRVYDCRVFAAAGLDPGGDGKAAISDRVRRWEFAFPEPDDRARGRAVRAAVAHLRERGIDDPTTLAVRAVEMHEELL